MAWEILTEISKVVPLALISQVWARGEWTLKGTFRISLSLTQAIIVLNVLKMPFRTRSFTHNYEALMGSLNEKSNNCPPYIFR